MEGIGTGVAAVRGALDTQADLAMRVLNRGASAAPAQAGARSGAGSELRTAAMQERGVGRRLDVSV